MSEEEFKDISVLVVDDDDFALYYVISMLKELGVRFVHQAKNGAEALEFLQEDIGVDVVITDWEMPVMDGIELTKTIRRHEHPTRAVVPIIMVTTHSQLEEVKAARDVGVSEFIVKPFSTMDLAKRVRTAIKAPRPFVKTPSFVGPDRRRKESANYVGESRRSK